MHVVDPRLLVSPDSGIGPDALRADFERTGRALPGRTAEGG